MGVRNVTKAQHLAEAGVGVVAQLRLAPGPNSRSRLLPRSSGQRWRAQGRSVHNDPTSLKRSTTSIAVEVATVSIAELQKLHPHAVVHVIFTINTQELHRRLPNPTHSIQI